MVTLKYFQPYLELGISTSPDKDNKVFSSIDYTPSAH